MSKREVLVPLNGRVLRSVGAILLLAGCALEPQDKDHCRLSLDCIDGRVCVAGRCQPAFLGFATDAAPEADAGPLNIGAPGSRELSRPADAAAKPDLTSGGDSASTVAFDASVAAPDTRLTVDARLKRDGPPPSDTPSPPDAAADASPVVWDAASDPAVDVAVPEPDSALGFTDVASPMPDLVPDVSLVPDAGAPDAPPAIDVPPDVAESVDAPPPSLCGDGVAQTGEACDDGNQIDDDACTNTCELPRCGDGLTQAGEQCDDGNIDDGDSCTACSWHKFLQIVGDEERLCGRRASGTVTCWGLSPTPPPAERFDSISDGNCGITFEGTIACWGGQLPPPPAGQFRRVDVGRNFACAIRTDGTLACWGAPSSQALQPPAGKFDAISAGVIACGVRNDGRLLCWGSWGPGVPASTGIPPGTYVNVSVGEGACATSIQQEVRCWAGIPQPTVSLYGVVVGNGFACGLRTENSDPYCWSDSVDGQGPPSGGGTGPFSQIAAGLSQGCGLHVPDGLVRCWAGGFPPPTSPPVRAVDVGPGVNWKFVNNDSVYLDVAMADDHHCLLDRDGHISCERGPAPPGVFRKVVVGSQHNCALDLAGAVTCWGFDDKASMAPAGTFLDISAGLEHTCGVRKGGALFCWGAPLPGDPPPPVGQFLEVSSGTTANCAVDVNRKTVCWGSGPVVSEPAPQGLRGISVGEGLACGLDSSGKLACWGDTASWPYIPRGTFRSVRMGGFGCALRRDGEMACFGPTSYPVMVNGETPFF